MSTERITATKPADIIEIETLIQSYNDGSNSQHRAYYADKMMLMADDMLAKLKDVK